MYLNFALTDIWRASDLVCGQLVSGGTRAGGLEALLVVEVALVRAAAIVHGALVHDHCGRGANHKLIQFSQIKKLKITR